MEAVWPIVSVVSLFFVLGVIAFFARMQSLRTRVGSFNCAVRRLARPAIWKIGIAHYGVDRLDWYRTASLSFRPKHTWSREDLDLVEKAQIRESDGLRVREFSVRVSCRCGETEFELAMSDDAYFGLRSWVESAPPGQIGRVV